jgi:hypothetical protein
VLEPRDEDDRRIHFCTCEFLSPTSIVVAQPGALKVYQILMETPGAPPVHTASFCMPPHSRRPMGRIIGNSRLAHGIDHRDLSDHSPFPSPSFRLAEDSCYLAVEYSGEAYMGHFHVPLSFFRRSPTQRDTLEIPWEVWSKGVYFHPPPGTGYDMSGGRLINYACSDGSSDEDDWALEVSLFDLNRSRVGRVSMTDADPSTDYPLSDARKRDPFRGGKKVIMKGPLPDYLASRSVNLDGSGLTPHLICDDEHILLWVVCYVFVSCGIGGLIFLNPRTAVLSRMNIGVCFGSIN